jgi:uncharacterized membrane protein
MKWEAPVKRGKNSKFLMLYGSVVGLGLAVIGLSLYRIIHDETASMWIALALLAAVTGSLSLKIPGMNGRVSVGDTVICLSVLLLGPYAGTLAAAADGLGGSLRCKSSSRRMRFALYNSGNSALSIFLMGQAALKLLGKPVLSSHAVISPASLLLSLCALAGGYFLMNTVLVAAAVALEKSLSFVNVWCEGFMWTCVNYLAGAFVAGMLAQLANPLSPAALGSVVFSCSAVFISCKAHIRMAQRVPRLQEHAQPAVDAAIGD